MAIKKIPCGGFFYDDETIEFDGKVISAKGGGGGSSVTILYVNYDAESDIAHIVFKSEDMSIPFNKDDTRFASLQDVVELMKNGVVYVSVSESGEPHMMITNFILGMGGGGIFNYDSEHSENSLYSRDYQSAPPPHPGS